MTENTLTLASSPADAAAASALEARHAEMTGGLAVRVSTLDAATDAAAASRAGAELAVWLTDVLLPALAQESAVLQGGADGIERLAVLVDTLRADERTLGELTDELRHAASADAAVGTARALQVLLESHIRREDEVLLPALAAEPGVALHSLVGLLPAGPAGPQEAEAGHACTCGEHDGEEHPELDARAIPHAIRHATIFGALDGVAPGRGMVLVAPHDPLPLLAQLEQRAPGAYEISYLERGPEAWRIQLLRRS